MSIQRYMLRGLDAKILGRYVPGGATIAGSGIQFIDINLTNDPELADLTALMESLGCTFVATGPTTPVTSANGPLWVPPIESAIVAGAVNVDVAATNTHKLTQLVANTALTFIKFIDGLQGTITVRQDGLGGRTLSFAAAGRTVLKDVGVANLNPQAALDSVTEYAYSFGTVDAFAYVMVAKTELDAA